ncbi:MAG: galactose mutarotase [Hyphomicrobiales bacterium]|nr:galactose mutarotase [Hyphomicrobiales bacterium]
MAGPRVFGRYEGGTAYEVEIGSRAGASAKIITWGAVVRDLVVPSRQGPQRVVLGLNTLGDYVAHSPYFGAVPGRFANRIAGGRFTLDGVEHRLARNEGKHMLHGGPNGFGKRLWTLAAQDASSATLRLESPDGDDGFPGALTATCVYRMLEPATLRVELAAGTDKPTVVNLTQHSYFNLDGSRDVLDHELMLFADFYTPADGELIPTGEILTTAGTPYDFRSARTIRNPTGVAYDTNFVASRQPGRDGLAPVARVRSTKNGLTLSLFSTEPGVQFYDAAKLDCPAEGLGGAHYGTHAGLCLEPQTFPDAPNRRHFPDRTLRPGAEYRHVSEFRFAMEDGGG